VTEIHHDAGRTQPVGGVDEDLPQPVGGTDVDLAADVTAGVTCDGATRTVTARLSGVGFVPNWPVTLKFETTPGGSYVTRAAPATPALITKTSAVVSAVSDASGNLDVVGYVHGFAADDLLYYGEAVTVSYQTPSGGWGSLRSSVPCTFDRRTTLTYDCDQAQHTITARMSGVGFVPGRRPRIGYTLTSEAWRQPDVGFRTTYPTVNHTVTVGADGTWSDIGYTSTVDEKDLYYLFDQLDAEVTDTYAPNSNFTLPVGRASTSCVYLDRRHG
jgi:hypothetical protein